MNIGLHTERHSQIPNVLSTNPVSLCALFCGTLLVTFDLSEFCDFYTHVILKLSVHSWFVAKLEKDFRMNEERGKDKC